MAPFIRDPRGDPEEPLVHYRQIYAIKSSDADEFNRLGILLYSQGRLEEAAAAFERVLTINPDHAEACHNLGNTLSTQGKPRAALAAFKKASRLNPENLTARHMVAALSGQRPRSSPRQFVTTLFDQYAHNFDRHVAGRLGCQIAAKLRRILDACLHPGISFRNVLDLGCGTGLSGKEFHDVSHCLTGVDLSAKMIEKAKDKNIYDRLLESDICEYLERSLENFDLFIAADVFVYVGDLVAIFKGIRQRTLPGAFVIFSTESCTGRDYILRKSGRYAHSRSYIMELTKGFGFTVLAYGKTALRWEKDRWIAGNIFVLRDGCCLA